VYGHAHRTIERALQAGRSVVFDATNLEENKRRTLYEIADGTSARLDLIWMWAPVDVIARRLWQRGVARDPEDRSDATWAVYAQLAATAQAPKRPFVVLNGTLSVDDQLATLTRILSG
jgi:predicted kinase